ncbi:CofH family radical SAM protein [Burkholderia sp. 3C]
MNFSQALELLQRTPLEELGRLAFEAKRLRHGDIVTYTVNRHINPTNLCIHACKFCDFAAKPKAAHAYSLDEAGILDSVQNLELDEVHVVGGLWPTWGFGRSLNLIRSLRAEMPDVWIKAFTAVEVAFFAKLEQMSIESVLASLKEAGVNALPGGGAEVLSDRIHKILYADKIGPDEYLRIHRISHSLGLPTNSTLLFGHIETDEEIIHHLFKLRDLQAETAGFDAMIPLAYQPGTTRLVDRVASPERCLRIIALSRLVLGNIPHIKAYWPTLQLETASAALTFGADDMDGTLGLERIMQLARTEAPARMQAANMDTLIKAAGQIPQRRSGSFGVSRYDRTSEGNTSILDRT